ncbi:rod-determining factor RdfA [Halomicrococcus sp. NG-SE-24]|uniref:rod-determining factor RdfA n=1 Tax=Halomicrococcus sp. NG-SE-24 TaxID=3436928 RepID=UPI003D976E0A
MTGDGDRACKIDRVSEKRNLDSIDEQLQERREDSGASLRDLEEYFNQRVLEAAMRDGDVEVVDGDAEHTFRLLTADTVSSGTEIEVRDRLRRAGVDPEAVIDDFVSYQTVRTHLRECLNVDTSNDSELTPTDAKNTVFKLMSRTELITERTIDRLRSAGGLTIGDVDVTLSLRVACTECGEEYPFSRLVDRGGCRCDSSRN